MWNRTFRFTWVVVCACAVVMGLGPVASGRALGRIVGGTVAPAGSWPAIVALVDTGTAPSLGQFCGGTLIDPAWVLTAAHCITETAGANAGGVVGPSTLEVVAGLTDLALDTGQRRAVAQIVRHPAYVPSTFNNDVALLHLASPVTVDSTVATMDLVSPIRPDLWDGGSPAEVAGWGNTVSPPAQSFFNGLRQASVDIQPDATCRTVYGVDFISTSMLCAGPLAGGVDSCQGDSGGPFTVRDGAQRVLVGAVSWGIGCAEPNAPGVYTRLDALRSFIFGPTGLSQRPPTAPVNVDASLASATSATVTWSPPAQSDRPVTGYVVRPVLAGVAGASVAVPASASQTTFNGLLDGGDYTFLVQAAQSAGIGPASAPVAPLVPQPVGIPTVVGTPIRDQALSVTSSWRYLTGDPVSEQWQRCDVSGAICSDIPGATGATFVLTQGDVGRRIRAHVTATNNKGSAFADSTPTAVIGEPFVLLTINAVGKPTATQSAKGTVTVKLRLQTDVGTVVTVGVKNPKGTRVPVDAAKSRIDGRRPTRVNARTISAVAGPTGIVQVTLVFTGHQAQAKKLGRLVIQASARGQTVTLTPGFRARF